MPSPIAHLATGYFVARFASRRSCPDSGRARPVLLYAFVAAMSILPDLDWIPDILLGQPGRFHNSFSHSLFAAVVAALLIGPLAASTGLVRFRLAFGLVLTCYVLHVLMDFFTIGRGVMLFWPLTSERFLPPVPLFYGVRWSDGLVSHRHLWTILSESVFVAALTITTRRRLATPASSPAGGS